MPAYLTSVCVSNTPFLTKLSRDGLTGATQFLWRKLQKDFSVNNLANQGESTCLLDNNKVHLFCLLKNLGFNFKFTNAEHHRFSVHRQLYRLPLYKNTPVYLPI